MPAMSDTKENNNQFLSSLDGLSKVKIKMLELDGKIHGWEHGLWTRQYFGSVDRTHESEYLNDRCKTSASNYIFNFLEEINFLNLNSASTVIEFGCNLGRNLRVVKERYDSEVYGIDINQEVIDKCNKFFNCTDNFVKANIDNGEFLTRYKDNQFDLGITCGFLLHVPANSGKEKLISEICRICKKVWFYELVDKSLYAPDYVQGGCITGEGLESYNQKSDTLINNKNKIKTQKTPETETYARYMLFTYECSE